MNSRMTKLMMAIGAMAVAGGAVAVNDSATFTVGASVANECVVGNTTNMTFGALSMLDTTTGGRTTADTLATATFDATCTNGTPSPTLKFASTNGGGSAFKMKTGAGGANELIAYDLTVGTSATGTAIAHNAAAAFTGFDADGIVKSLTVAGNITAAAKVNAKVGTYADTVTITVGYTP